MATTPGIFAFWGDSRMVGSYGDAQNGGIRAKICMAFPGYNAVGTVHDVIVGPQSTASPIPNMWNGEPRAFHAATNGYGIANVTSVIAARVALMTATPTVHVVLCGVNDINGGDSAATMLTKAGACLDQFHTTTPSAKVVWLLEPNEIYGGGATDAVRATFNSGMAAVIAARSAWAYSIAMPTDLPAGQFGDIAGIHPNAWGFNRMADAAIAGLKAIPI